MRLSGVTRVDAHTGPPGDPAADASAERPFAIACRPLELPHPAQGPICITSSPAPLRSAAGFPEECAWPTPGRVARPSQCRPETTVSRRADRGQSGPSWNRGPRARSSEQDGCRFGERTGVAVQVAKESRWLESGARAQGVTTHGTASESPCREAESRKGPTRRQRRLGLQDGRWSNSSRE